MSKKDVKTKVTEQNRSRRFGGRLTPGLYRRLERIADYEQRSVSAQVEIALREWIEQEEERLGKGYRHSNSESPVAVLEAAVSDDALATTTM